MRSTHRLILITGLLSLMIVSTLATAYAGEQGRRNTAVVLTGATVWSATQGDRTGAALLGLAAAEAWNRVDEARYSTVVVTRDRYRTQPRYYRTHPRYGYHPHYYEKSNRTAPRYYESRYRTVPRYSRTYTTYKRATPRSITVMPRLRHR